MVELSCDYLVGCDGSRSYVRQGLGIELHGSTFKERWLSSISRTPRTPPGTRKSTSCNPSSCWVFLPGRKRTRRFEFMLHDGEEDAGTLAPENVASLLRLYGTDDTASIRRKVVYTFHARIADRWRAGRISSSPAMPRISCRHSRARA